MLSRLTLLFPSLAIVAKVKVWQTIGCLEGGVHVEQVGNVGEVETLVALDNVLGTDKLSASNLVSLLKHLLRTLFWVVLL